MKDQYFGDKRDYFKYDLMIFLAQMLPGIQRFTFIPMLTCNDGLGHGGKTNFAQAGGKPALYMFLQKCVNEQRRSVAQLRTFFAEHRFKFEYCHYHDKLRFAHQKRESYFEGIPGDFLQHTVILVDPDNGLEVKAVGPSKGHRYIRYDEVNNIYLRMSESSIFVIFQFFPRIQRQPYLRRRFQELHSALQCPFPIAISDNEIAFIILAKSNERRTRVLQLLKDYTPRNERFWVFDGFDDPKVSPS
jgi:hypothetical protein